MISPAQDHPFAVWKVFHGAPRWWLARGCPPTLLHQSRLARAVRAAVLLGAMGLASAWLCTVADEIHYRATKSVPSSVVLTRLTRHDPTISGIVFGIVVMLPLSRWTGRGWGPSLAAIPASLLVSHVAFTIFLARIWPHGNNPWKLSFPEAGLMAGLIGGGCLGAWMCDPRRRSTWTIALVGAAMGGLAGCLFGIAREMEPALSSGLKMAPTWRLMRQAVPYTFFQTLVAIALGGRLWNLPLSDYEDAPCPAANTDATGTENPSNSTEVAVSPDLNSP